MGATEGILLIGSLVAVAAFWLSPPGAGQNVVAGLTAFVLLVAAPISAAWLLGTIVLTPVLMQLGECIGRKGTVVFSCTVAFAALFFVSRFVEPETGRAVTLVGGAYFTLRHIHVLMEWWLGRVRVPTLAAYARYHLFLPVLAAGPIHRMPHFERQCARRRWDVDEFYSGAERALFGVFLAVVVGNFAFAHVDRILRAAVGTPAPLAWEWLFSAVDWVKLYFQFSGLADAALGLSLMMGLRLEENFNRPWRARNLVDFWNRWHITLSHWCRDYVYVSIAAHFRAPVVGVVAAMLVIGLWHETSVYYVVWAFWQALGIVLNRVLQKLRPPSEQWRRAKTVLAPVAILAWLSAARPLVQLLLGPAAL